MPAHLPSPLRALALVLAALLLVTGCSLRWDTPPPEVPSPDSAEQARQTAAEESASLVVLAEAAGAATELTGVVTAARAHLEALGGVWEPWPGAGPQATAYPGETPSLAPTPPPGTTPQDVLTALTDGAASARAEAAAQTGELSRLLASISISRTFAAVDLAAALGTDAPPSPAAPLPTPADDLDAATVQVLDSARYAFEVVAAQSSDGTRDAALERADELGALAAVDVPGEDLREVAYDVSTALSSAPEGTTPQRHLAARAELDVMTAFLARIAAQDAEPVGSADGLIAAATYAAGQARSWDAELPVLPGLG